MSSAILETANVDAFFHDSVIDSVANQNVDVCDETIVYITQLLTHYVRSDQLFEQDEEGVQLKPLALLYCSAASAGDRQTRSRQLKQLGDLALFVSGWFAHNIVRRRVGVKYYTEMGECAYDWLSEIQGGGVTGRVFTRIFQDLAANFSELRDVISEIQMTADRCSASDLLGLYELWQRSGSLQAAELLRTAGIDVLPVDTETHTQH